MKRLVIIRHAKSSWANDALADFDRPLNDRGKSDAPLMGRVLADKKLYPDYYLCSPAKRAITTARKICNTLEMDKSIIDTREVLYLASAQKIIDVIASQDLSVNTLFLTGHNPGLTDLCNRLSEVRIDNLPTCGIFVVDFKMSEWSEIAEKQGHFNFYDYPKKHY